MIRSFGFSLIELMVVIAIVALLAAAASVSYKNRVAAAKMQTFLSGINVVRDRVITFAEKNGRTPKTSEIGLGMTQDYGSWTVANPATAAQLLGPVYNTSSNLSIGSYGTDCGKSGYIIVNANFNAIGITGTTADTWVICSWWNIDNIIKRWCGYQYQMVGGATGTENFIPGVPNVNRTSGGDAGVYTDVLNNPGGILSATCP